MGKRNRNTALVLMAAGLFLLVHHHVGFWNMAALLLIVLGAYKTRVEPGRSGYVLAAVGGVVLLSGHLSAILAVFLIALGVYYMRSKKIQRDRDYMQKHRLVESLKWDRDSWILRNMSLWHIVGEARLDLTLAIPEQPETTLVIQGGIGDVDIIVPDYLGVVVVASAVIGELDVGPQKEAGFVNRVHWQSPNYGTSPQNVRIEISYLIADIDVKIV